MDRENTVKSLWDQLRELVNAGNSDSGFPILRSDMDGMRMIGYIGANELEHALSTSHSPLLPSAPHPILYLRGAPRRREEAG